MQLHIISNLRSGISISEPAPTPSHLHYCNFLYFGICHSCFTSPTEHAAARVLTGTKKRDQITVIVASLLWLPVSCRVHFKIPMFVFMVLNDFAPSYIKDILTLYQVTDVRSSDRRLLGPYNTRTGPFLLLS